MSKADWRLYLRLMSTAVPYSRAAVVLIAAVLVGAALEPMLPALMKPLIDENLVGSRPEGLWVIPLLLVIVVFLRGLSDYAVTYTSQYIAARVVEDLRKAVFIKSIDQSLSDCPPEDAGRMMSRITYDTHMVAEAVSDAWMVLIRDSLVLLGLTIFLFYTVWELAFFVFISFPVLVLAIRRISDRLRVTSANIQDRQGRLTAFIQESLLGLREIKIFAAYADQEKRFHEESSGVRKEQMRAIRTSAFAGPLVALMTAVTVAAVIYLASLMSSQGRLSPGEFVSFITALAMVFGPIRRLASVNMVLQRGLAAAESIFTLLDSPSERCYPPKEVVFAVPSVLIHPHGSIVFEKVSFSYPGQSLEALKGLSFTIEPREAVALIGPSGSGKSTVVALIAGLFQPTTGVVLIDGYATNDWDLRDLRSRIAMVSQRITLFNGTVRDNILMGRPTASETEVLEAARAAHCWDFIEKLPQRLDTSLGGFGDRLSGGQRQRIAIARAYLKDAPILLLDEPTSALDDENGSAVLTALKNLCSERTVLIVSHKPTDMLGALRTVPLV